MKKFLTLSVVVFVFLFLNQTMTSSITIPKDAIRFRVIASSNSKEDQEVKQIVSKTLEKEISSRLLNAKTHKDAEAILTSSLPVFQNLVAKTLQDNHVYQTFKIHYGKNYFPEKVYNGVTYKEGEYDSLVVTLGNGLGDNWWCVLFPPLCLMEAEEEITSGEVEYRLFLKDWLEQYF